MIISKDAPTNSGAEQGLQSRSEEEEGFFVKEQLALQIITTMINRDVAASKSQNKAKAVLRNPLCIYSTSPLYSYPEPMEECPPILVPTCQTNKQGSIFISKSGELSSAGDPVCKLSQLLTNNRLVCVYTRHGENLVGKSDIAMVIKNVKKLVQNDMLFPFSAQHSWVSSHKHPKVSDNPLSQSKLKFESNFQCGNLHCAFKQTWMENYYLLLQNDVNTHGYNQWFNFWVTAASSQTPRDADSSKGKSWASKSKQKERRVHRAHFFIVNISKDIKYCQGMRIVTFRGGRYCYDTPFLYYRNKYERYNGASHMTIQFAYDFEVWEDGEDVVQFSLAYPYTCTRLVRLLKEIKQHQSQKWDIFLETIGRSQGNNFIYLARITKKEILHSLEGNPKRKEKPQRRKAIIVIARQHPGEPVSSFVCQHLLDVVINSGLPSEKQYFDWFVIPMANPDGVVHGNSRTNLKGYDINRCWSKDTLFISSEATCINRAIEDIHSNYSVDYIIDLHGHSKDLGSFAYFTENTQKNRTLNFLMSQKSQIFNYYKAKYGINYKKRPTLRGQMFYREQIKNSITVEASLYGYKKGDEFIPFEDKHYRQLASALYHALLSYEEMQVNKLNEQIKFIATKINERQKSRMQVESHDLNQDNSSVDSDSDPQDEYLEKVERLSLGIEVVDVKKQGQNIQSYQSGQPPNLRHEAKVEELMQQKQKSRKVFLNRYNILNKKSKEVKRKRKPIYTNTNVQMLSLGRLQQMERLVKRYSIDQSSEILGKKINQAKEPKRSKRAMSSMPEQRRISTADRRYQSVVQFPTSSNVKLDPTIIGRIQQIMKFQGKGWAQEDSRERDRDGGQQRRSYYSEVDKKKHQHQRLSGSVGGGMNKFRPSKQDLAVVSRSYQSLGKQ